MYRNLLTSQTNVFQHLPVFSCVPSPVKTHVTWFPALVACHMFSRPCSPSHLFPPTHFPRLSHVNCSPISVTFSLLLYILACDDVFWNRFSMNGMDTANFLRNSWIIKANCQSVKCLRGFYQRACFRDFFLSSKGKTSFLTYMCHICITIPLNTQLIFWKSQCGDCHTLPNC